VGTSAKAKYGLTISGAKEKVILFAKVVVMAEQRHKRLANVLKY
jgi:hypothetical protein